MPKRTIPVVVLVISSGLIWGADAQNQSEPSGNPEIPPPRPVPGITSEDQFPEACVSCHLNFPDMGLDTRFSTVLARWAENVDPEILLVAQTLATPGHPLKGVHPQVELSHQPIPRVCLDCHNSGANNAIPLVPFLHKIHLGGTAQSIFLSVFQGECTHCHKFNDKTGLWSVPDAEEL